MPAHGNRSRTSCWLLIAGLWTLTLLAICSAGCGPSSSTAPSDAAVAAQSAGDGDAAETIAPRAPSAKSKAKPKGAKNPGGAHIGEIPRDAWPEVFFKEPLTVLSERASLDRETHTENPRTQPVVAGAQPRSEDAHRLSAADAADWAALLSGEELVGETKAIRSSLTGKLQSVSKYNGNYKELRVDAATLAALAGIAGEHSEPPGWKDNARYIRDVSAEIARSASANGDKFYKPTKTAYEKLDALLSGSKPPGVGDAAEKVAFSEVARRGPLMLRIDRAFNYMKLNVNTEAILRKESAKVSHEAAILAALARVVASPGYDDADLDEYRKLAREMEQCGTGVAAAAKNGDFKGYAAALDRGAKACTECHMEYRNN